MNNVLPMRGRWYCTAAYCYGTVDSVGTRTATGRSAVLFQLAEPMPLFTVPCSAELPVGLP